LLLVWIPEKLFALNFLIHSDPNFSAIVMDLQSEMEQQNKHSGTTPLPTAPAPPVDVDAMCQFILDIRDVDKREQALLELR
jgi:hypothetical protein